MAPFILVYIYTAFRDGETGELKKALVSRARDKVDIQSAMRTAYQSPLLFRQSKSPERQCYEFPELASILTTHAFPEKVRVDILAGLTIYPATWLGILDLPT